MLGADKIRSGVTEFRRESDKPLNLNFFCHAAPTEEAAVEQTWLTRLAPSYSALGAQPPALPLKAGLQPFGEEACALVEELKPTIMSFHFGLPAPALLARGQIRWLQGHRLCDERQGSGLARRARRRCRHCARR